MDNQKNVDLFQVRNDYLKNHFDRRLLVRNFSTHDSSVHELIVFRGADCMRVLTVIPLRDEDAVLEVYELKKIAGFCGDGRGGVTSRGID